MCLGCNENRTLARAWQTPSQSVPLFPEKEGEGGRINPDISNLRRRNRLEAEQQRMKLTQFPRMTFKSLQLWHKHVADIFDPAVPRVRVCVEHVRPRWDRARATPDSLRFFFTTSHFPSSCLSFGVLLPNFRRTTSGVSRQNSPAIVAVSGAE